MLCTDCLICNSSKVALESICRANNTRIDPCYPTQIISRIERRPSNAVMQELDVIRYTFYKRNFTHAELLNLILVFHDAI
jgi:hypothetical protein